MRRSTLKHAGGVSGLAKLVRHTLAAAFSRYVTLILNLHVQAGLNIDFTRNPARQVIVRSIAYPILAYVISYVATHTAPARSVLTSIPALNDFWLSALPVLAFALAIPAYPILIYLKAIERGRRVESELKYFLISESVIAAGDPDLVEDLASVENASIFPALSRESVIFRKLRKLMTAPNVVSTYCRWIRSRFVNTLLKDYVFASALGAKRAWLREKGEEILNDVRIGSLNIVKARTLVSVLLAVILGYLPPMVLAMATLLGQGLLSHVLVLTLISFPFFFAITPKPPMHFRTFASRNLLPVRTALLALCLTSLITAHTGYYAPHPLLQLLRFLWKIRIPLCVALLAISLRHVYDLVVTLREASGLSNALLSLANAPLGTTNALNLVKEVLRRSGSRSLRELSNELTLGGRRLGSALTKAKLWLTKYVMYTITRVLAYGVFSRESMLRLRELAAEMMREFRTAAVSNLAVVALCVSLPYILTYVCSFNPHMIGAAVVSTYITLSSLLYSVYVSYVVFDDPLNTLLPALIMLELSLTSTFSA